MNRDPLTSYLGSILLLASLATAGVCYWYLQVARDLQTTQYQVASINRNRALIQSLVTEAVEYSKKNPAIMPVLESAGLHRSQAGSSTNTLPEP